MPEQNNPPRRASLSYPKRLLVGFLRLFFKLLYHQFAWAYDGVAAVVSLGEWQKWVSAVMPHIEGARVLEIGFGPGHLQAGLNHMRINIFGLDESRQMVNIAHRRLLRMGYPSKLVRGDALHLPYANASFHQVVMTFPAEYILNPSLLTEIHHILMETGNVLIVPLAWITGQNPVERLVAWVNRVSGEAPEWDEKHLEPLKSSGFDLSWEIQDFNRSKILLIQMQKKTTGSKVAGHSAQILL